MLTKLAILEAFTVFYAFNFVSKNVGLLRACEQYPYHVGFKNQLSQVTLNGRRKQEQKRKTHFFSFCLRITASFFFSVHTEKTLAASPFFPKSTGWAGGGNERETAANRITRQSFPSLRSPKVIRGEERD